MMKRLFDFLIASIALAVVWPLMLVIAALVILESRGGAIFRQRRVGRDGKNFEIYKFRTMLTDHDGPRLSPLGDLRVTTIGAHLRRTKLDELPQLVNVIKGEMSIVGPRPELPAFVKLWPEAVRCVVLSVRPGITDPASLVYRDEALILSGQADAERFYLEQVMPKKLEMYVRYVRSRTFAGDLRIISETFARVLMPRKSTSLGQ